MNFDQRILSWNICFSIFRFLIRMGWKDCDEITYEITDKDKEEYEKRIQLLPKVRFTNKNSSL